MGFLGGVFGSARNRFGNKVLAQVLAYDAVESAEFDEEASEVVVRRRGSDSFAKLSLETLFERCAGQPEHERVRRVADLVEPFLTDPETEPWESAAKRLRPVVRPSDRNQFSVAGIRVRDVLLARPVLPFLSEMVVLDNPSTMRFVTTADLTAWGVEADEVYSTAHSNLTEVAMSTLSAFDPATGTQVLDFADEDGDSYVGSLPLVGGWLAGAEARTGSRPLVFLPAHAGMLVVLGANPDTLLQVLALAEERYDEALRPLSPVPYTIDDDGDLVPFCIPLEHPAWQALRHAETRLAATVYGGQTDKLRADDDLEEAISALMHLRAPDGSEHTMTPWTGGTPTLLPHADYILFVITETNAFRVAWSDVAALVSLTPVPGYDPPRYRVDDHPSPSVMARLRALAS
ncbi:hypothetical protein [Nocardia crassostreae]|uniref:hypothetical protein n=1 Tax=Nocardia crassostreae TaxID=53428 RepID=UPI0012FAD0A2|nr:hypothetical protein [Nocardia crassostreae]